MFGNLRKYETYSYFRTHPIITCDTQYEEGDFLVFAALRVNTVYGSTRFVNYTMYNQMTSAQQEETLAALLRLNAFPGTGGRKHGRPAADSLHLHRGRPGAPAGMCPPRTPRRIHGRTHRSNASAGQPPDIKKTAKEIARDQVPRIVSPEAHTLSPEAFMKG